jgi:rhodanese-related sulfurtransferase
VQKKLNYALQDMSREAFIEKVTDGILPPPQYFYQDAKINKTGYDSLESVISRNTKPLSLTEFMRAIESGATVLDTRKADDFETGFVPGSVNIGLNGQFAVWVGTLIDIRTTLVLVTEPGKEEESVLRLARIGFENIAGFLAGGIDAWQGPLDKIQSISSDEMKAEIDNGCHVLDVRKPGEWNAGHVKDAKFVPLSEFPQAFAKLNKDRRYIVHCGGGYRSMTAISIMRNHGFTDLANVSGGYSSIQKSGIQIDTEQSISV